MKTILQNAVVAGVSLVLVSSPLCRAENLGEFLEGRTHSSTHSGSVIRGKKLDDAKVFTTQGEQMGTIDDVLLDPKTGQVSFAVLGIGGWLGIGEKKVIVPWQLVRQDTQKPENFIVQADKEKLKGAPSFEGDKWEAVTQPDYLAKVQNFFGLPPQGTPQTALTAQPTPASPQGQPQAQDEQKRLQQAQQQAQEQARQQTQQAAQAAAERAKQAQQQADEAQRQAQAAQKNAQQEAEKARQAQQAAQTVQKQQQQGAQVGAPPQ
ncbi:PRC-barrel domain-containing protein [Verrucomicrobiota bacterium sgz303538]